MSDDGLYLDSGSLLSKWGFNDGDIPDAVYDILWDDLGWTGHTGSPRFEWSLVLLDLVRDYLLPALAQQVELVRWVDPASTSHNPARAARIDGIKVPEGVDRGAVEWTGPQLTPAGVTVPWDVIRERCRKAMEATDG